MARVYTRRDLSWKGPNLNLGRKTLAKIVQDEHHPTMWRVRRPDGTVTDMVNRTRAMDAAYSVALATLNVHD